MTYSIAPRYFQRETLPGDGTKEFEIIRDKDGNIVALIDHTNNEIQDSE